MSDHVVMQTSDHVGLITLDDPGHRNAVTREISAGLRAAVECAESDPDVHALIITGAGRAFCAGADLTVLQAATKDRLHQIYDGFLAVADCALPTIAAVNGPAVGAGLNLALACDVRIVSPSAVLDGRFLTLGVHPGGGATWMLHRAVGPQLARAALLFGMVFDAETAVQHGLALQMADDVVAAAKALAKAPATAPRDVVLATKATMRATIQPGSLDYEQHALAVAVEVGPQLRSLRSPEFTRRVAAASHRAQSTQK